MVAAGAAVHQGLGDRAVSIAELAVERTNMMGADGSESLITLALALCQVGRPEEALAILDGDVRESPYAASVEVLASAMIGDASRAIDMWSEVVERPATTYLDRVIGAVGASAADTMVGEHDRARERLVEAAIVAREAGDVVARALVASAMRAIVEHEPAGTGDHLGLGWVRVVEVLGAVSVPPPTDVVAEPA
jgi:hypothetical protein